jgi:hypothetical protein
MPEASQVTFTYKELAEILVRQSDIHSGHWALFFGFGIGGANMPVGDTPATPCAIVPITQIGIQKYAEPNPLTVDAAEVNPPRRHTKIQRV